MGRYLNPGNEAFQISVSSEIYVDKTNMISFINNRLGKEKRFICVSRPRRFGKSMAANMLAAYYGKNCDSKQLFRPYKIAEDKTFYTHLNQYHVLFFEMQRFLTRAGKSADFVPYIEREVLKELRNTFGNLVDKQETHLSRALESIYEQDKTGFVIILDEWDCIFRESKNDSVSQKAYLDFLRDLFKGQVYVKLAYMTGILPIKKYGSHSALNIFDEFSMTNPGWMAEYVGFTEEEVLRLCQQYHMDFFEMQRWYDGYQFKKAAHIYNPKSIIDSLLEEELQSYWTKTETYEALKIYIAMNMDGLKDSVIIMLGGGRCSLDVETFQNDMTTFTGKDDILTLLIHLGYLAYDKDNSEVFIPNEEVRAEFARTVRQAGWDAVTNALNESNALLDATLNGNEKLVAERLDDIHTDAIDILSYNNELSLTYVVMLAYFSAQKYYIPKRELQGGKGFADVVFLPRRGVEKPPLIVELKWNKNTEGAMKQIKDKKYLKCLNDYVGEVILVGINYSRKTKTHQCIIEKIIKE